MRTLLLIAVILSSGCFGSSCHTLGHRATVETTEDLETIRSALLAEGWVELENEGPRPVFRLDDRHTATVYNGSASTRTIDFDHLTPEGARELAAPVAQRLDASMSVEAMEHCGQV